VAGARASGRFGEVAEVVLEPERGRRHWDQLRRHLAGAGQPIVGDAAHGVPLRRTTSRTEDGRGWRPTGRGRVAGGTGSSGGRGAVAGERTRLMLWAEGLRLVHPTGGWTADSYAPPPQEFLLCRDEDSGD
jgi:23S rRNA-/tRNA-specific pseudouridylate synthase